MPDHQTSLVRTFELSYKHIKMKKAILLLLLSISISQFSFAKANNHVPVNTEDGVAVFPKAKKSLYQTLTFEEMMTLKPKEIRARTGKKLSFGKRIGLKVLQAKYKKAQKKALRQETNDVGGTDTVSLLSFIFSLTAFLLSWLFGPFILLGLAGLILGIIALADSDRFRRKTGKGFAIAGVAIGGTLFLLLVLAVVVAIAIVV